jgi:hypothetical protein
VRDALARYVVSRLGNPAAVLVADEIGFSSRKPARIDAELLER